MGSICLRISDMSSFAVEFSAHDGRSFRLALRKAMFEYRAHFLPPPGRPMSYDRPIPGPALQIKNPGTGDWLAAVHAPRAGKHCSLPTDIVELTCHAAEYWEQVVNSWDEMVRLSRMSIGSERKLLPAAFPRKRHLRIVSERWEE